MIFRTARWTPLLAALAIVAAACNTGTATTSVPGSEPSPTTLPAPTLPATTTTTTTTTIGERTGAVGLVAYSDPLYGMRTVVPEGWVESPQLGYGVLVGDSHPGSALVVQFAVGASPAVITTALGRDLQLLGPLEPAGVVTGNRFEWSLFESQSDAPQFGGEPTDVNVALAESDGGVHLVLLASPAAETDELRDSIFLPAVESLSPPDLPEVDAGAAYLDASVPIAQRVEDLLGRMTLLEKIGQMTLVEKDSIVTEDITLLGIGGLLSAGGGAPTVNSPEAWADMTDGFQERALATRLRIPVLYGADAVHGHNNLRGAVIFPHNIGLGAAGDPDLVERVGQITAVEAAATGVKWNYAPVVAVPQDIRWGRTYEAYGEDTALVTALGTALVRGLQGPDLADASSVLATPKHYVADGGTAWGSSLSPGYAIDQGVARIDEAELRRVHLPPYEAAIDAGALSMMASFSSWDGLKMHAQSYLLTDVLKSELGFEGFVVSDWAGVDQISDDYSEAVTASVNAGIDMNMVPSRYHEFIWTLGRAVREGNVAQERIDDAVRRILLAKFALGLFEDPYAKRGLLDRVGSAEHRALAREAVGRSLVLLKNEEGTLPIGGDVEQIFVGGEAADDIGIQSGGWTIEWQGGEGAITPGTTIFEGVTATAPAGTMVYHDRFGRLDRVDPNAGLDPDLCLAVLGERPYAEGRGDEFEPELGTLDLAVLENMAAVCDRLAVVLISGRPLLVADLVDEWDALVAAWLPGSEGDGVARVLFGLEPFTGRLPFTWPRTVDQLPRGATDDPLYPYGFGLTASED